MDLYVLTDITKYIVTKEKNDLEKRHYRYFIDT